MRKFISVGVFTIYAVTLMSCDPCRNSVYFEAYSPDGAYKAVVFQRDCGTTTAYSTHVTILKAHESTPTWDGSVMVFYQGFVNIGLEWVGNDSLVINYPSEMIPSKKESSHHQVAISYGIWEEELGIGDYESEEFSNQVDSIDFEAHDGPDYQSNSFGFPSDWTRVYQFHGESNQFGLDGSQIEEGAFFQYESCAGSSYAIALMESLNEDSTVYHLDIYKVHDTDILTIYEMNFYLEDQRLNYELVVSNFYDSDSELFEIYFTQVAPGVHIFEVNQSDSKYAIFHYPVFYAISSWSGLEELLHFQEECNDEVEDY